MKMKNLAAFALLLGAQPMMAQQLKLNADNI